MREFCEPTMPVLLVDEAGMVNFMTMGEVCAAIIDKFIQELIAIPSFYRIRSGQAIWVNSRTPRADNHKVSRVLQGEEVWCCVVICYGYFYL